MICTQTLQRHTCSVSCLAVSRGCVFSGALDGLIKVSAQVLTSNNFIFIGFGMENKWAGVSQSTGRRPLLRKIRDPPLLWEVNKVFDSQSQLKLGKKDSSALSRSNI